MVRTGAKPDWRAASLNQFFWQPSRTVPIHCTDNWKRRKVLEQSPVYRSLAGRGWIKYCIVSNITNCTPSCRQLCRWHYFISLFLYFFTTSFCWLIYRNALICFFAKSMSNHGSFCQIKWQQNVQSWLAVGRIWPGRTETRMTSGFPLNRLFSGDLAENESNCRDLALLLRRYQGRICLQLSAIFLQSRTTFLLFLNSPVCSFCHLLC